jgi:CHAT domain
VIDLGLVVGERGAFGVPSPTILERVAPAGLRELHVAVCAGQIGESEALIRARGVFAAPPTRESLIGPRSVVHLLCGTGQERQGLLLARLLLSAVVAVKASVGEGVYEDAADLFVEAGSLVLFGLLARPLYEAVTALADESLARAREKGGPKELLAALDRAAGARVCLTLEGRDLDAWADESAWRVTLRDTVDDSVVNSPNIEVLRMPDVLPELLMQEQLLQERLALATTNRSRALLQLVQVSGVLRERSSLSTEVLIGLARQAAADSDYRMDALQQLDRLGAITDEDREAPVFAGSLAEVHREMGPLAAVLTYRTAGWLAMRVGRHEEARRLTLEYLRLPVEKAPEDQWLQALDVAVHCGDLGLVGCDQAQAHASDAAALLSLIPPRAQPVDRLSAHLHAALHAANLNVADAVLDRKGRLRDGVDSATILRLVRYVRGTVALGTAIGSPDGPARVERQLAAGVEAFRLHAELRAPRRAGLCAEVVARLVDRHPGLAEQTAWALLPVLDRALSTLGSQVDDQIAQIGEALVHPLKAVSSAGVPTELAFYHSQLFKGLRTAKVVRHSGPFSATVEDLATDEALWRQEVVATRETLTHEPRPIVVEELMTLLYATGTEGLGGGTALDELRNLRFVADMSVRDRLYRERLLLDIRRCAVAAAGDQPRPSRRLISYDDLLSRLGTETVLVDLFDAAQRSGNYGFYIQTYNASHSFTEDAFLPDLEPGFAIVDPNHPGRVLHGANTANFVARLRHRILEDPGPRRPVVREVTEMLRQYPIFTLEHDKALPLYRERGAKHVCLWPHGPLNYAPLHLFEVDGHPLADEWTVTSLATPASLSRRQAWPDEDAPTNRTISVLAASSPDGGLAAGYPSVPELARQAEAVATTAHDSVLLGPREATPEAILAKLPHCRYAHLAAHGNADVYTPSFQALHFTGESGRGRLTARQVARADLRNVELVSLSACESGLGRFDRLDNHLGLSAALLGAGVTAVVSCLWQVRPAPASVFFVRLYEALAATNGDLRAAFRAAQLTTREAFPAYRDWGTFVYSGGW